MNTEEEIRKVLHPERNAIELTEEGSELRGLVAEALAYADGDAGAFYNPPGAGLRLDIEHMDDALYNDLLDAFQAEAERQGISADHFDYWKVSCIVSKETDE